MEVTTFESNPAAAIEQLQEEYTWLPTPELERKALKVFKQNAPKIRAALGSSSLFATMYGIDEFTLNALLEDYARALLGVYIPVATPAQIATLKPLLQDTMEIDRWGLGIAVINTYWNISQGLELYTIAAKSKASAAEYLNGVPKNTPSYIPSIQAVTTLYQTEHAGLFDYDLFREAVGEQALQAHIAQSLAVVDLYAYTLYFGICEYILGGKAPKIPKRLKAIKNLEEITRQRAQAIEDDLKAANLTAAPEIDAPPAPLRITLRKEEAPARDTARLNTRVNSILSRSIEYARNPEKKLKVKGKEVDNIALVQKPGDLVPILKLVEDGLKRSDEKHLESRPSELRIEQALGGVNILFSQQQPEEVNGLYTITASLNELATAAGLEQSWNEKLELIDALRVVDGVYLALVEERKTIAVKILTLRKIVKEQKGTSADGNDKTFYKLTIDLTREAVDNGSQSLLYADYFRFRQEFNGAAGQRFIHQILCKHHITEDDLIDEIFGNKTKIKEAELGLRKAKRQQPEPGRTPAEEAALIRRTLEQNRPRQRKQLAAMFEKAKELGFIDNYSRRKAKTSKGYVYSWTRKTPAASLGLE